MKNPIPVLVAAGLAASLVLAGCASPSGGGSTGGADTPADQPVEQVSLTVGILPLVDAAAAQVALDKGYFADENLDVSLETFGSASALTPALVSGSVQFGLTSVVSNFNALAQQVPIVSVAPGVYWGIDDEDPSVLMADASMQGTGLQDLGGRSVSIIAFKSLADIITRAAIEKSGGDLGAVEFVEVPFADGQAAIDAGRIDAAYANEPWISTMQAGGKVEIGNLVTASLGRETEVQEWVTSAPYAAANPGVVERFQAAIQKANADLEADPSLARDAVLEYLTTLDPAIVEKIRLPKWKVDNDRQSYEDLRGLMAEYAGYEFEPDLDAYLALNK